tara:strand:- start:3085 stop:3381 length:297 start_codon:yes stop_codon:yes gene_type:complete
MKKLALLLLTGIALTVMFTSCAPDTEESRERLAITSLSPSNYLYTTGLNRIIVEESGQFLIVPSKGMAVDTAKMAHPVAWKFAYYKLNSDSTRYIMCR